jgi:hypothetical protein
MPLAAMHAAIRVTFSHFCALFVNRQEAVWPCEAGEKKRNKQENKGHFAQQKSTTGTTA